VGKLVPQSDVFGTESAWTRREPVSTGVAAAVAVWDSREEKFQSDQTIPLKYVNHNPTCASKVSTKSRSTACERPHPSNILC
jgi:hypothetical protein